MHLDGTYTFNAPRQAVWDTLLNPEIIAQCMPGRESFTQVGPDEYEIGIKVKVGPISGSASGRLKLADQQPPDSYRMEVAGGGAIGNATGSGTIKLRAEGAKTVVAYDGELQVTGKVASVGQRLLGVVAKQMVNQFFKSMESKVPAAT